MRKAIRKVRTITAKAHLTRRVCDHVIGDVHTVNHRMICGSCVILVGVVISGAGSSFGGFVHIVFDGFGYLVHAIGTVPFIEKLSQVINNEK